MYSKFFFVDCSIDAYPSNLPAKKYSDLSGLPVRDYFFKDLVRFFNDYSNL